MRDALTAPATKASPAAVTAVLPALEAVLTVDGAVASGLEWNGGLLSAPRADHACTLWCAAVVSAAAAAARLLVLLGLAACFAALRRRIAPLAEKLLILSGKRE